MDGIKVGDETFADVYDAALCVIECGEGGDITIEPWVCPENYIGPMYDTVVRENYYYAGRHVIIRYTFTAEEVEGKDPEDWPYDNGSMEIELDYDFVCPVEVE